MSIFNEYESHGYLNYNFFIIIYFFVNIDDISPFFWEYACMFKFFFEFFVKLGLLKKIFLN